MPIVILTLAVAAPAAQPDDGEITLKQVLRTWRDRAGRVETLDVRFRRNVTNLKQNNYRQQANGEGVRIRWDRGRVKIHGQLSTAIVFGFRARSSGAGSSSGSTRVWGFDGITYWSYTRSRNTGKLSGYARPSSAEAFGRYLISGADTMGLMWWMDPLWTANPYGKETRLKLSGDAFVAENGRLTQRVEIVSWPSTYPQRAVIFCSGEEFRIDRVDLFSSYGVQSSRIQYEYEDESETDLPVPTAWTYISFSGGNPSYFRQASVDRFAINRDLPRVWTAMRFPEGTIVSDSRQDQPSRYRVGGWNRKIPVDRKGVPLPIEAPRPKPRNKAKIR